MTFKPAVVVVEFSLVSSSVVPPINCGVPFMCNFSWSSGMSNYIFDICVKYIDIVLPLFDNSSMGEELEWADNLLGGVFFFFLLNVRNHCHYIVFIFLTLPKLGQPNSRIRTVLISS